MRGWVRVSVGCGGCRCVTGWVWVDILRQTCSCVPPALCDAFRAAGWACVCVCVCVCVAEWVSMGVGGCGWVWLGVAGCV